MKTELWFSEAGFCFIMFEYGNSEHRAGLDPDARLLAVFEADSWADAQHQKEEFLRGPNGFVWTYSPSS